MKITTNQTNKEEKNKEAKIVYEKNDCRIQFCSFDSMNYNAIQLKTVSRVVSIEKKMDINLI